MKYPKQYPAAGFTIIELLIATVVFALVLILVTTGVMQFTRQYYKGVISSNTQNAARSIIDDVTRAIQFNAGSVYSLTTASTTKAPDPTAKPVGYCIGEAKRYSFALNAQVTEGSIDTSRHQSRFGLLTDTISGCNTSTIALDATNPLALTTLNPKTNKPPENAREMLGEHMRVVKFKIESISSIPDAFNITVRVVYGDDALLCTPSVESSCDPKTPEVDPNILNGKDDIMCKTSSGSQFCAVSELTTTVKKRVN